MYFVEIEILPGDDPQFLHDPFSRVNVLSKGSITQVLNAVNDFKFEILPTHPLYESDIRSYVSLIKVRDHTDEIIFRGRVVDYSRKMSGNGEMVKTYVAECELAYLLDSMQEAEELLHVTIDEYFKRILSVHNYRVRPDDKQINLMRILGNDSVVPISFDRSCFCGTTTDVYHINYTSTYQNIKQHILGAFGGYIWLDYPNGERRLNYSKTSGELRTMPIELAVNLESMSSSYHASQDYTRIIPLGAELERYELAIERLRDVGILRDGSGDVLSTNFWLNEVRYWRDGTPLVGQEALSPWTGQLLLGLSKLNYKNKCTCENGCLNELCSICNVDDIRRRIESEMMPADINSRYYYNEAVDWLCNSGLIGSSEHWKEEDKANNINVRWLIRLAAMAISTDSPRRGNHNSADSAMQWFGGNGGFFTGADWFDRFRPIEPTPPPVDPVDPIDPDDCECEDDDCCDICECDTCDCKPEECDEDSDCCLEDCECEDGDCCDVCEDDTCDCKPEDCDEVSDCCLDDCECGDDCCDACEDDTCDCKPEKCDEDSDCCLDDCECGDDCCDACEDDTCDCKPEECDEDSGCCLNACDDESDDDNEPVDDDCDEATEESDENCNYKEAEILATHKITPFNDGEESPWKGQLVINLSKLNLIRYRGDEGEALVAQYQAEIEADIDDIEEYEKAVDSLANAGVIHSPNYWKQEEQAEDEDLRMMIRLSDKMCDPEYPLMMKPEDAITWLKEEYGFFTDEEEMFWRDQIRVPAEDAEEDHRLSEWISELLINLSLVNYEHSIEGLRELLAPKPIAPIADFGAYNEALDSLSNAGGIQSPDYWKEPKRRYNLNLRWLIRLADATIDHDNPESNFPRPRLTIQNHANDDDWLPIVTGPNVPIIEGIVIFDTNDPAKLRTKALRWIEENRKITNSVSISAVDLSHLDNVTYEDFRVGDSYQVINPILGIYADDEGYRLIQKTIDVVNPSKSGMTFGDRQLVMSSSR